MSANESKTMHQAWKLNDYAQTVRGIRGNLYDLKSKLNSSWKGAEMAAINEKIDDMIDRASSVSSLLDSISDDMTMALKRAAQQE